MPLTAPERPSQWRHLILDGHNSRTDDVFMLRCLENKVWIDFLPAHCSQVLQPLDLGPFSVLKRKYRDHLRAACRSSLTMTPKKPEFLEAWMGAWNDAFTPSNIAAGWLATGIFPRNRSKPLNSRLARQHLRGDLLAPDLEQQISRHARSPRRAAPRRGRRRARRR